MIDATPRVETTVGGTPRATAGAMSNTHAGAAGVLELGTHSIKLHLVRADLPACTQKVPWQLGHRFFASGGRAEPSVDELVEGVRAAAATAPDLALPGVRAIATGVFRELPRFAELAHGLARATGVRPELLSGSAEAEVLADGFGNDRLPEPLLMLDLGGASTEWVRRDRGARALGSLPLGAVRLHHRHQELDPRRRVRAWITDADRALRALAPGVVEVAATGGTARALAAWTGAPRLAIADLQHKVAELVTRGAPPSMAPARALVILPGLIILWRVLVRCGAGAITLHDAPLRRGLLRRFLRAAPLALAGSVLLAGVLAGASACGGDDAGAGDAGDAGLGGPCGFDLEALAPRGVGHHWVYQTTDTSTGALFAKRVDHVRGEDGRLQQVTHRRKGTTTSDLETVGDRLVRPRKVRHDLAGNLLDTTTYDPPQLRLDGSAERIATGAGWNEAYVKTELDPLGLGGPVDRAEYWQVIDGDEACRVAVGDLTCLHLRRTRETGGTGAVVVKDYWYARGVGKVREDGADKLEELSACSID